MQQPPDILVNGLQKQNNPTTEIFQTQPKVETNVPVAPNNQNFLGIDLQAEFLKTQEIKSPRKLNKGLWKFGLVSLIYLNKQLGKNKIIISNNHYIY